MSSASSRALTTSHSVALFYPDLNQTPSAVSAETIEKRAYSGGSLTPDDFMEKLRAAFKGIYGEPFLRTRIGGCSLKP